VTCDSDCEKTGQKVRQLQHIQQTKENRFQVLEIDSAYSRSCCGSGTSRVNMTSCAAAARGWQLQLPPTLLLLLLLPPPPPPLLLLLLLLPLTTPPFLLLLLPLCLKSPPLPLFPTLNIHVVPPPPPRQRGALCCSRRCHCKSRACNISHVSRTHTSRVHRLLKSLTLRSQAHST